MEFLVFAPALPRSSHFKAAEEEYLKRISSWFGITVKEFKASQSGTAGKELIALARPGTKLILLDEHGKQFSTQTIASKISEAANGGIKRLIFGIGPADGWDEVTKKSVREIWSLSQLTLPYALARTVLIEQLYRSLSIINNTPYHRGD